MNLDLLYNAKSGDLEARNFFIEENKKFIHRYACIICKKYLSWENDDELSVALMAFNYAIDSFKSGDFRAYSKIVIKNKLIDYFRKASKNEIPVDDEIIANAIEYQQPYDENLDRASQIIIFKDTIKEFGISINDLLNCSPKHKDTRKKLMNLAFDISKQREMSQYIMKNKMLPTKDIISKSGVSRKFIDEWRKYIIALVIIFYDNRLDSIKEYILEEV